jgi:hypothetical protein
LDLRCKDYRACSLETCRFTALALTLPHSSQLASLTSTLFHTLQTPLSSSLLRGLVAGRKTLSALPLVLVRARSSLVCLLFSRRYEYLAVGFVVE